MRVLCVVFVIAAAIYPAVNAEGCEAKGPKMDIKWTDLQKACTKKMKEQVAEELKASMQYLAMGAHFSNYKQNKPGFAEHFFKAASEEREHAMKLISYLLMRGNLIDDSINDLISEYYQPEVTTWNSGLEALEDALKLEVKVTQKIRNVIKVCEEDKDNQGKAFNHFHLVDYLTGDFLEEQYKGQREIAGMISTLSKMKDKHGALGEFLFDKTLLG